MIFIVAVFTHKCFDNNYHKIAYSSKHVNIIEISQHDISTWHARMEAATSISDVCKFSLKCVYMEDLESFLALTKLLHCRQTIRVSNT
jgi:hypothetical protein